MRMMKPYVIDDTRLFSSDIPEPDASMGEVAWVSGTAYLAGVQVIRTQTHRKYIALVNVTSTTPPENDPTRWRDIGPTNRYAAFDYTKNTASTASAVGAGVKFVITPIQRISNISIFGIDAQMVVIRQLSAPGGALIAEYVFNLQTRFVNSWYEYLTEPFVNKESVILSNLPPTSNATYEIIFQKAAGLFSVESVTLGMPVFIGKLEYGAGSDILDFSRIERDEFGAATLVRRKNVPTIGGTIFVKKEDIPKIFRFRKDNQATPLVFLGIEEEQDDYFEAVSGLGILKGMPILIEYHKHSLVNLEVEGL